MTYEELGALLRLGKTAMWRAKKASALPQAVTINRQLRFRESTVLKWIEQQEKAVSIDTVFAERASKAIAARTQKSKPTNQPSEKKQGRPTKAEQIKKRMGHNK